jgi:hypothetical protein
MIESCRGGARAPAAEVRAFGVALGYPACCIDAFLERRDLANSEICFHALRRTPGEGARLLNNFFDDRRLISHHLCRYDCAPSLRYAEGLLAELRRARVAGADDLDRRLAGLVVSVRREGAVQLRTTAPTATAVHGFDGFEISGDGPRLQSWRAALADADRIEARHGRLRILRGGEEIGRFEAPSGEVEMRAFA